MEHLADPGLRNSDLAVSTNLGIFLEGCPCNKVLGLLFGVQTGALWSGPGRLLSHELQSIVLVGQRDMDLVLGV